MASTAIDNYITKCYSRWLDYARYHASLASISDQAEDILNEVLASLLEKPSSQLTTLLNKRSGQYTELDFYVLKMIKLNARSDTAPYRFKTKTIPQDCNISPWDLEIVDQVEDSRDIELIKLQKYQQAREILDQLNVSSREKEIFSWKFFGDNHLIDWPGQESYSVTCSIFLKVKHLRYRHLHGVLRLKHFEVQADQPNSDVRACQRGSAGTGALMMTGSFLTG